MTSYGEYGYSMGDSTWVLPAAGGLSDLALVTVSADGPLANELGAATYTTLVPEPSAVAAWLAAAVLVAACFRRRR